MDWRRAQARWALRSSCAGGTPADERQLVLFGGLTVLLLLYRHFFGQPLRQSSSEGWTPVYKTTRARLCLLSRSTTANCSEDDPKRITPKSVFMSTDSEG